MNDTKKLVIYGAGELARMFLAELLRSKLYEVAAFTVDEKYIDTDKVMGLPLLPFETVETRYAPDEYAMVALCGYKSMRARRAMYLRAKEKGYPLINYVSPDAVVDFGVEFKGDNNIVMANAVIGFDSVFGSNNIIRQNVYLGHEATVGDDNIISSACCIGGKSTIGSLNYLGLSVTCRDHAVIGNECLIGMGSVVTKPIDDYATAYGVPAKIVSYHKDTGVVIER